EAGARATLAVLLALHLARVARDVAVLLQRRAERRADLDQRARDAVADRLGLAGETAAAHVHQHVVAADRLGRLERLTQHHLAGRAPEVVVDVAAVDLDVAGARGHPDARHRGLAAAGGVEGIRLTRHVVRLRFSWPALARRRDVELGGLLRGVLVLGT